MPTTRRAAWRRPTKPARNEPLPFNRAEPPAAHEDLSSQEMAEIEWMLELMGSAECAMGCDYSDGPMSPSGCQW